MIDSDRECPMRGSETRKYMKLRITGIECWDRTSDTSLLDPSLMDFYLFLWSDEKRVSVIASASMRGSGLPILSVCSHSTESLKDPHSGSHPPKDCVFVIKEWRRSKGEEELGTCGFLDGSRRDGENTRTIGVGAGVGHCQNPCTSEP